VLVDGMLGELRCTGGAQEGRLADLALEIHSLDVCLQLRLGSLPILRIAFALLLCLGSVTHVAGMEVLNVSTRIDKLGSR